MDETRVADESQRDEATFNFILKREQETLLPNMKVNHLF